MRNPPARVCCRRVFLKAGLKQAVDKVFFSQKQRSLGQAFSKACRVKGQRPLSPSADGEIPIRLSDFCRGLGEIFARKNLPQKLTIIADFASKKGAGGTFFDEQHATKRRFLPASRAGGGEAAAFALSFAQRPPQSGDFCPLRGLAAAKPPHLR
ncbi:MAG: hypothetical protein ACI4J7_04865 [Ruminiclostridium sp.]